MIVIGSKLLLIMAPIYKNASLGITRNRHNEYRVGPDRETNDPAYGGREGGHASPDRFASLTRNDRSPAELGERPGDSAERRAVADLRKKAQVANVLRGPLLWENK